MTKYQSLKLIVLLTLSWQVANAEDFLTAEASITYVLNHNGHLINKDNEAADERFSLHCLNKSSYILVEPEGKLVYRFQDTKESAGRISSGREKCEKLETKLRKFGASKDYEVVVNPTTTLILSTKEISKPEVIKPSIAEQSAQQLKNSVIQIDKYNRRKTEDAINRFTSEDLKNRNVNELVEKAEENILTADKPVTLGTKAEPPPKSSR